MCGQDGVPVKEMYVDHPARQWVAELPEATPERYFPQAVPEYPLDSSDGGCDCSQSENDRSWVKQTDAIEIVVVTRPWPFGTLESAFCTYKGKQGQVRCNK